MHFQRVKTMRYPQIYYNKGVIMTRYFLMELSFKIIKT